MKNKPSMDQYFLKDPAKIRTMLDALQITGDDVIAEAGAGMGSISSCLPSGNPLYLLEADPALCRILHRRFKDRERTVIMEGDAFEDLEKIHVNKLIISLPWYLSERMLEKLSTYPFSRAVMAVRKGQPLPYEIRGLRISDLCTLEGDCFDPVQPYDSRCLLILRTI